MWTSERIEEFSKSFGHKPFSTKSEMKELPNLLRADEQLLGLLEGNLKEIHGRNVAGQGLVIVTDKRVVFFRKSFIGTVTKEETPIGKISSASFRKGLMMSTITITTSNNESTVETTDKALAQKVVDVIQNGIHGFSTPGNTSSTQPEDNLSKIEKLFELKEKGILTEEEFAEEKRKLLNV